MMEINMKSNVLGIALVLAMTGMASADEARMKDILTSWDSRMTEWNAAYEFAQPERRAELEKTKPDPKTIVRAVWKETSPLLQKPESLPAVVWLLEHPEAIASSFDAASQKKIAASLLESVEHYLVSSPGIGRVAPVLGQSSNLRCREILEKIRTVNQNPKDQGMAAMGLVLSMREKNSMLQDDPKLNAFRLKYLREAIQKSFEESFGDLGKVKDIARELLYDINNLSTRRKAPAFSLPTAEGAFVSIPKAVPTLLVFWKPDSVQSASLVAKSNVLKEKYPNLDIVPICLSEPAKAAETIRAMNISIPGLYDAKGSVFQLYRIAQVPSVYLLDKEGVVRLRGVPDMLFESILDQTMSRLNSGQKDPAVVPPPSAASQQQAVPVVPKPVAVPAPVPNANDSQSKPAGQGGLIAPPPLRPMPEDA